ncbi:hypothetical protein FA10DRAFT_283604 [Acaromyces ingoldii]|uniref:Uncharacterized protein n=1 Tax=Acaromyces ingoldii TaxID=215250 RepID=A0A316Z1D8_9BASI|nr:hypothetical protein FA10DRAFT_283604 [Acaromyces ingoldii]PWN93993.1 hypothetical protein FA10DRAFT_283604 [Acaromyces ingoldii]
MSSSIPPTGTFIQPQQQQASERSVLLARGPVPHDQHSPLTSPSSSYTGRNSASAKRKRPRRASSWFPSCCGSDPALYDDDGAGKRKLPVEYQSKLVIKHHVPTVSHHIEICTPPPSSPPQVIDLPLPLPSFSSAGHSSTTIFSLGSQAVFATPTAAAYGDAATVTPASSASTNSYSRFQDAAEGRQGRLRAAPASAQTLASLTASPPDGLRPVSSMVEIGGRLAKGVLTSREICCEEIPQRRGADEKRRRRRLGNIEHYDENVRAYLGALQHPSMDGDRLDRETHNQQAEAENPEKRLSTASTLSRYSSQSTGGDGVDDNNGRSKRQDQASFVSGKVSHSSIEHSTSRRRATASCTSSSAASSMIEQSRSSGALSERSPPIGDVLCQFPSLVTLQGDRKLGMASLVGGATRLRGFDVDDSHDDDDVYGKGEEVDRASITSSDIEGLLVKAGTVSDRDNQSPSHSTDWQNKLVPENSMQSETPSRDNMHRRKESGAHSLRSMKSVRTLKRAANDDGSSASSPAATPRHSRKRNASVSSARSSSGAPRSSPPELPLPPVPATAGGGGPQSVRRATVGTSAPSSSSSKAGVLAAAHQKRTTAPARVRLEASAAALHRQRAQGQFPHAGTSYCRASPNRGSYYEQGQSIAL